MKIEELTDDIYDQEDVNRSRTFLGQDLGPFSADALEKTARAILKIRPQSPTENQLINFEMDYIGYGQHLSEKGAEIYFVSKPHRFYIELACPPKFPIPDYLKPQHG